MVSIKDIAAACGVSTASVSKALNGHRDISEATRKRIQATAKEMGYLPNASARALKTNRTYNLGVLFVDDTMSGLTHEHFSAILNSFKMEAEEKGYDITFINHNIGGKPFTYLEHCRYRGLDGVVIASVDFTDSRVMELINSGLPVVTIDHVFNNTTAVLSDNVEGMEALVRHVYAKGHRKLAMIHGELTSVTQYRLASFYKTCQELGLEIPDEYIRLGVYHDAKACARVTRELLSLEDHPTCIFFPDDFSYLGGYNVIVEAGLQVPQDISTVGYDGIYLAKMVAPQLTTYHQNTDALGRTAARLLINQIEHPKTTLSETVVVNGYLQEGKSVRDLNQ